MPEAGELRRKQNGYSGYSNVGQFPFLRAAVPEKSTHRDRRAGSFGLKSREEEAWREVSSLRAEHAESGAQDLHYRSHCIADGLQHRRTTNMSAPGTSTVLQIQPACFAGAACSHLFLPYLRNFTALSEIPLPSMFLPLPEVHGRGKDD